MATHTKHRRARGIIAAAVLIALPLSACGSAGGASSGDKKEQIKIVAMLDSLTGTWPENVELMKAEVQKYNDANPSTKVTFDVNQANSDVSTQISQSQNVAVKKPDVALFTAVDSKGSLPGVQALKDAGVKVLDIRPASNPSEEDPVFDAAIYAYWEQSFDQGMVDWLKEYQAKDPGKKLNIGVIYGAPAQVPQLGRGDYVKKLAEDNPDKFKVVASAQGDWVTDKAQNITQDWVTSHPEMNVIVSASGDMAQGVYVALKAANKVDQVASASYDLDTASINRIKTRQQTVAVGVPNPLLSKIWIEQAINAATGKLTEKTFINKDTTTLTGANIADYEAKYGTSKDAG